MLELICDHQYTWEGLPADKSPYHNHGTAINTSGAFDGVRSGSGVITFPQANSRVKIGAGPSSCWQRLIALKIEVLARVNPLASRSSVLVAGHGSFRFGLSEGALEAQFNNVIGVNNYVRSADAFAPNGKMHSVPDNRWVKLGLYHDGFARMRLFLNEELVGEAVIEGSIPAVQVQGVSIGNEAAQDGLQFPGQVDELRIWRLDPKAMKREFLGRPYTPDAAQCWQRYFEAILEWIQNNPEQGRSLAQQINNAQISMGRSLLLLPENEQKRVRAVLVAFADLWFAGKLTGREMENVLCQYITLLSQLGIDPSGGLQGTIPSDMIAQLKIRHTDVLRCDPQIADFIKLLQKAVNDCGKA